MGYCLLKLRAYFAGLRYAVDLQPDRKFNRYPAGRVAKMYAVVETGGKQYRVGLGETIKVETLSAEVGGTVELDRVLMIVDGEEVRVGQPLLDAATVSATVVEHGRGDKIRVFKMKRRKGYRRTQGHRQNYTALEVTAINV